MKAVHWVGDSLERLREFPEQARCAMGFALRQVQNGETPDCAKPLKGLPGVLELRDDHAGDTFRVVYVAKFGKAVYVLHAFKKKSKSGIATPRQDVELVRRRLNAAKDFDREGA